MGPRAGVLVVALCSSVALLASGCGGSEAPSATRSTADPSSCRQQWADLGDTVVGLDDDTDPSALAERWTTVIATLDYYANAATARDCGDRLDGQQQDIDALRRLTDQLRPFDMTYQYHQVKASIVLYLHDPLPAPAKNENGKTVRPPGKPAVLKAYEQLGTGAAAADADLARGWQQVARTSVDDATALRTAVEGLDALAQNSAAWRQCEASLQVLVAAINAQEGASSP